VLGAEVAGDFKPKPKVYLASAAALDLPPDQCMMVAAHSNDLKAAAAQGLRTAHIARPNEYGPNTGETAPKVPVDFAAASLEDLAGKLGV
jgi:2-haloacid dehalogenase